MRSELVRRFCNISHVNLHEKNNKYKNISKHKYRTKIKYQNISEHNYINYQFFWKSTNYSI